MGCLQILKETGAVGLTEKGKRLVGTSNWHFSFLFFFFSLFPPLSLFFVFYVNFFFFFYLISTYFVNFILL